MRRTRAHRSVMASILVGALFLGATGATAGAPGPTLTVTKTGNGAGSVTSNPVGIDCGATCAFAFPTDTMVELTAVPNGVSSFEGWNGACSGTGTCQVTMDQARNVSARFDKEYRPDAWIKLCGLSDGCTIQGLPNPWKGKDRYNDTGKGQKISVKMEDGEGVRFWLLFENDGVSADTFRIEGCKGTPKFKINKVQVGFYKKPTAGSVKINEQFKNGTAEFNVGPSSDGDQVKLTLNIIAPTTAEGVTYKCPITVHSEGDPDATDTLMAIMTTY